jgi:hypothetical protein
MARHEIIVRRMHNTSCADANRVATLRKRAVTSGESTNRYLLCHEGCPSRYYQGMSTKTVTALLRHLIFLIELMLLMLLWKYIWRSFRVFWFSLSVCRLCKSLDSHKEAGTNTMFLHAFASMPPVATFSLPLATMTPHPPFASLRLVKKTHQYGRSRMHKIFVFVCTDYILDASIREIKNA